VAWLLSKCDSAENRPYIGLSTCCYIKNKNKIKSFNLSNSWTHILLVSLYLVLVNKISAGRMHFPAVIYVGALITFTNAFQNAISAPPHSAHQ
jgi:hypothetical protein